MYNKEPELAALISSRICHDLASPLGAISNGLELLELLELSGISETPEMALLKDAVEAANARLAFFRIAFGPASEDALMEPEFMQSVLMQYGQDKRLKASWEIDQPTQRPICKLLFLLFQCMETALPYGGEVRFCQQAEGWLILGTGRIKLDKPLWQVFFNPAAEPAFSAANIQFALAKAFADQGNHKLTMEFDEATIRIALR